MVVGVAAAMVVEVGAMAEVAIMVEVVEETMEVATCRVFPCCPCCNPYTFKFLIYTNRAWTVSCCYGQGVVAAMVAVEVAAMVVVVVEAVAFQGLCLRSFCKSSISREERTDC